MKQKLIKAPILCYADLFKVFVVAWDAFGVDIVGILI